MVTCDDINYWRLVGDSWPVTKDLLMLQFSLVCCGRKHVKHLLLMINSNNSSCWRRYRESSNATTTANVQHATAFGQDLACALVGRGVRNHFR
jgi:hypothetical protein